MIVMQAVIMTLFLAVLCIQGFGFGAERVAAMPVSSLFLFSFFTPQISGVKLLPLGRWYGAYVSNGGDERQAREGRMAATGKDQIV